VSYAARSAWRIRLTLPASDGTQHVTRGIPEASISLDTSNSSRRVPLTAICASKVAKLGMAEAKDQARGHMTKTRSPFPHYPGELHRLSRSWCTLLLGNS
jgi:hypothetical protein